MSLAPRKVSQFPPGYYLPPSAFYRHPLLYDMFGPWLKLPRLWEAECEQLAPQPGDIVLDACSGTGALASRLARALQDRGCVIAVDLTVQMVRRTRRKAGGSPLFVVRGSTEALPFADDSFDKASISVALHEMPREARARALGELSRVTRPGGKVVVGEFWPSGEWYMRWFESVFEEPRWIAEMHGLVGEVEDSRLRVLSHELLPGTHFQVVVATKER